MRSSDGTHSTPPNISDNKICPIKKLDGSLALSDLDKANLFGKHLSNIFVPHSDNSQLIKINNFLDSPLPMSFPTKHVSSNEM